MQHTPELRPRGRGVARLAAVSGNSRGGVTGARARAYLGGARLVTRVRWRGEVTASSGWPSRFN
jgi:hypothetical protein